MNKEKFLKLSLISKGVIATCALVGFLMEMFLHGWHSIRYYSIKRRNDRCNSSNWTGVSLHASSFKNT